MSRNTKQISKQTLIYKMHVMLISFQCLQIWNGDSTNPYCTGIVSGCPAVLIWRDVFQNACLGNQLPVIHSSVLKNTGHCILRNVISYHCFFAQAKAWSSLLTEVICHSESYFYASNNFLRVDDTYFHMVEGSRLGMRPFHLVFVITSVNMGK